MLLSEIDFGVPFKFDDCDCVYKKILPFDAFPCVCCVEEISIDLIQLHIYEDYEVFPIYPFQQSLF